MAEIFRPEQNPPCEDVPQFYSDWIQIYSSQPPSCFQQHQPPLWEEDFPQRQHLGSTLPSLLPGSFAQPAGRQLHHPSSTRSYQTFRNLKPQSRGPGAHQPMYGGTAGGGGHASVDQVVPSHSQPMYWEVGQSTGHPHHHHHHHPPVGPQTSMGYISDLIYNAAIVTNFLEF